MVAHTYANMLIADRPEYPLLSLSASGSHSQQLPVEMHYAPLEYCTDNGAMIAAMGYELALAHRTTDPLTLGTDPSLAV